MSNKLIGRKVKVVNGLFYKDGGSNIGTILEVERAPHWNNNRVVLISDGESSMVCYPNELRYLNNKEVVL